MFDRFINDLTQCAPEAGPGTYTLQDSHGQPIGYVQFISHSPAEAIIHRIWMLHPRRGDGSAALTQICALADQHQLTLKLKALPLGVKPYPLSRAELVAWYGRHGFAGSDRWMTRLPRCVRPAGPCGDGVFRAVGCCTATQGIGV